MRWMAGRTLGIQNDFGSVLSTALWANGAAGCASAPAAGGALLIHAGAEPERHCSAEPTRAGASAGCPLCPRHADVAGDGTGS